MTIRRAHIVVKGRVQGVFFRANTQEVAMDLGLVGSVKNRPDGSVEIVAEGEENALKALEEWCYKGPPSANVIGIEAEYLEPSGEFKSFGIRYY